ncbi:MAG: hypothetical protein OXI91_11660 [Chloroflexota bacterium]|nr:hypothetical protein [Chloroflexota bacterium]
MNQLLQDAFNRAITLPPKAQDRFAGFLLAELDAGQQWDQLFDRPKSDELLSNLANETLADNGAGSTTPLDPTDF